jgi:hypothetical protein
MTRGPTPKANRTRKRDERHEITPQESSGAPQIPDGEWSAGARDWWDTWASSPQAGAFTATDWLRLRMLLPLVEAYFDKPSRAILSELRLNEARLGATVEDRQRMRVKIEQPAPPLAQGRYDHIKAGES